MGHTAETGGRFRDRLDAGERLAERLEGYRAASPLVLAIPRGGVPVGAEVARHLGAELDVVVARKLGAPSHPELAIGAVTADGARFLNQDLLRLIPVDQAYLAQVTREQGEEARRRETRFRQDRPPLEVAGRTVLLVDDGLATGATMRAAARAVRKRAPARLVVAVPVGSRDACAALHEDADEVVCLVQPEPFYAVGMHYREFPQVEDAEVVRILERHQLTRR